MPDHHGTSAFPHTQNHLSKATTCVIHHGAEHITTLYHLPVEILSEILVLATLPFPPVQTPIRLASITSYLRHVALNTPGLWSSLSFSHDQPLHLLELQISRARSSHLDVSVDFPIHVIDPEWNLDIDERDRNIKRIKLLHNVMPRISRLRILQLGPSGAQLLDEEEYSYTAFGQLDCAAPELRHLTLHLTTSDIPSIFLGNQTPNLRSLSLKDGTHAQIADVLCRCHLVQDLTLEIHESDPYELEESFQMLRVLRAHSSTLVTLDISVMANAKYTYAVPRGSLLFPQLTKLVLVVPNGGIVDPITAPQLEYFCLVCNGASYTLSDEDEPVECYNALQFFLQRHKTSLVTMIAIVVGYPDYPWDAAPIPRISPVYTKLKYLAVTLDAAYVEEFCTMLAPALERVVIDFGERYAALWDSLASFIRNHAQTLRYASVRCLTFVPMSVGDVAASPEFSMPLLQTFDTHGADLILLRVASAPVLREIIIGGPALDQNDPKPFGFRLKLGEVCPHDDNVPVLQLPALESLHVMHPSPVLPRFRAPNLRHVKMESEVAMPVCLDLISRHAASIISLDINGGGLDIADLALPTPLSLAVGSKASVPAFQMPVLQTLSLYHSNPDSSFLAAFPSVTHLTVDGLRLETLWKLWPLRSVVELTIKFASGSSSWYLRALRALATRHQLGADYSQPDWLFPSLRSLRVTFYTTNSTIRGKAFPKFDIAVIKSVITARQDADVASVESLTFIDVDYNFLLPLQRVRQAGASVHASACVAILTDGPLP